MSRVLIQNHGARIVTIQLMEAGRLDLGPGLTPIPADAWEELEVAKEKNPALTALFDAEQSKTALGTPGHLEFKGPMKESDAETGKLNAPTGDTAGISSPSGSADPGLADYTVEEAKELIGETLALQQLRAWRAGEEAGKNRTGVISALDAQISKITSK